MVHDRARIRIPVSRPDLGGNERQYVNGCLTRNWITAGPFEKQLEEAWANYCGVAHAVAVNSGTAALHLALRAVGVTHGDEVIVPATTYAATAFAVLYCGATPIVVDVDPETWCIDVAAAAKARTARTKAVVPVHLYGAPADLAALSFQLPGVAIVEDAAEAHGAVIDGVGKLRAGAYGDVGCFSFYGNKIVTTGEGGMLVTDSASLAWVARLLRGQGTAPNGPAEDRYWHAEVGFNYRMTDLQAAIGVAQMERLERVQTERAWLASVYAEMLPYDVTMQRGAATSDAHARWQIVVKLPRPVARDVARRMLDRDGIETRPVFPPLLRQPALQGRAFGAGGMPVATELYECGLVLPTFTGLTVQGVSDVSYALSMALADAQ